MNAVEYVSFIFAGPEPANGYYGNFLWFGSLAALYLQATNALTYPLWHVALGLSALHFLLNIYQMNTARVLTETAQFGELDDETSQKIDVLAKKGGVKVTRKQLITNFPTINAFCARARNNAEIYISHHWQESEEGKNHLMHILGHEIGHAFYNDPLKRALVNSSLYSLIILSTTALYTFISPHLNYSAFIVAGIQFIGMIASSYLQAMYHRYSEFRADSFGAHCSSPDEMKQALLFLENLHPNDKIQGHLPEWKQGSHPKMTNRVARLEAMISKHTTKESL